MRAADVMASRVVAVRPDASVQHVARVLLANRISGVLVVDTNDELLGIVSEGDLLRRVEAGTERSGSWWVTNLTETIREMLADDFVKSHSRRVSDIMTHDVIVAEPDTPLTDVVSLFEKFHIKRVPIVENEKVVGIVTRANVLQALAGVADAEPLTITVDDATLRDNILANLKAQRWIRNELVNVTVHNGTVDLWGLVSSAAEKKAVLVAAEITPGVQTVSDHLTVHAAVFEP